jgi:protein-S-isoprenylcysteine O-methyltransferase Ste14
MIESILVTILPVLFLILLFSGDKLVKGIDIGGKPPINKAIFLSSKYVIVLLWAVMAIHSFGVDISMIRLPILVKYISLILWFSGFTILFAGKSGLGESFRIGQPNESTTLKTGGLFRFSRNPMYLGVYATVFAVILYAANLAVLLVGLYVLVAHHLIVLAEEKYLKLTFGKKYKGYCRSVRRYI